MKHKLFVGPMSPNGTRDLYILGEDWRILEVIGEAIFGNVPYLNQEIAYIDDFCEEVYGEHLDGFYPIHQIDIQTVIKYTACSPVDPEGLGKFISVLNSLR